jgi:anti-sigma factor RsiW
MTRPNRPIGEDDLTAYVDGELPSERRALVEKWLAVHPEDRARVTEDQQIKARLADSLAALADTSLPDQLRVDRILADRATRRMGGVRRMAAVVALVAASGAGGWVLRGATPAVEVAQSEVQAARVAYNVYVPEKLHPVEVSADAQVHLGKWLGNRLGAPVKIPDLGAQGLTLLGGRLLPGNDGQPAGQLMYETAGGERVTLYLQGGFGAETAFVFSRENDVGAFAWRSPDLAYVLTGAMTQDELLSIAHAIQQWTL